MDRRYFIEKSLLASGSAIATLACPRSMFAARPREILVLGGTNFLGPAIVEAALIQGHEVTLFNRGQSHPEPEFYKCLNFTHYPQCAWRE